jgi:hypothetical protein
MGAIKARIITPHDERDADAGRGGARQMRQALLAPTIKLDKITTVLPNLVNRFNRMLEDLARATRYEIDKARGILHGLVGEKKVVLRPTTDRTGNYLTAELAGDYAGLIPLIFRGK